MEIFFHNYTKEKLNQKEIEETVTQASVFFNLPKETYIEVLIVGEKRIRSLNKQHRNIDKATDVLSFPIMEHGAWSMEHEPSKPPLTPPSKGGEWGGSENRPLPTTYHLQPTTYPLGTILVCPHLAAKRSERIIDLVLHGFVHLLGHDHETDIEAEEFYKTVESFTKTNKASD